MMIDYQALTDGILLFLPLCPSTNARMKPVKFGWTCRDILTKEARNYISMMGQALRNWARLEKFEPIKKFAYFDLWFILPRTNCDAHNYGKVLFDALEEGGIVANDKYILPRVMGVWHDSHAEVVIKIPIPIRSEDDNETRPCQLFKELMDGR